jgi:hypothetical protein
MASRAEIRVEERGGKFHVTVIEDGSRTSHRVEVDPDYAKKLSGGVATTEELVRLSFEFLLEREPKESILSEFNLRVIQRYFPDYEREIGKRLAC